MERDLVQPELGSSALIEDLVMDVIMKYRCANVREAVTHIQNVDKSISSEDIIDAIKELNNDKKIILLDKVHNSFMHYLKGYSSISFWLIASAIVFGLASIYFLPNNGIWSIVRYAVAAIFILLVPGYSLIQLLFPSKIIDSAERLVLGVGLSLGILPLVWLTLHYSPWDVTIYSITSLLMATSMSSAIVATYKRFVTENRLNAVTKSE